MWHVWKCGEMNASYLIEKLEKKRPFGRSRPRWEDNIKTYIKAIGLGTGSGRL
jgi:hypothetical protein